MGCRGYSLQRAALDVVTAAATVGGAALSATGTITVASATAGSIKFISATPGLIGLKGTGGLGVPETSTVIFNVTDSTGGPVANDEHHFSIGAFSKTTMRDDVLQTT